MTLHPFPHYTQFTQGYHSFPDVRVNLGSGESRPTTYTRGGRERSYMRTTPCQTSRRVTQRVERTMTVCYRLDPDGRLELVNVL
jgi:hypothetical protein